ncbi:hypothetical protein NKR19_g449 [Coniochaeta hoffmannii]|uniref:Uncharacterized protein n=1 Tax=Coniochaeta hoffmannii TaxID=91930 RepID=A0AA38W0X0_9PEZI|nr:hypothetical protein NKR19_g449 [Coniochaeta hoffmannii]
MPTDGVATPTSDPTATGLELGLASFATNPPTATGLTVTTCDGVFDGNHIALSAGKGVTFLFSLDQSTFTKTPTLRVFGLASRNDPTVGNSPITLTVNGRAIVSDYAMPGQGWGPENASFQIPPAYLVPGTNAATLQVAPDAAQNFCLYQLAVDLTPGPYTGDTLEANLRTNPVTLSPGLSVSANSAGGFVNGCSYYPAGGALSVVFSLTDANARNDEVRIKLTGLVSRNGDQVGHAPISVTMNGQNVLADYTVPGNGWAPTPFEIRPPAELCVPGPNTVTVSVASDATTSLWLYDLVIQKAEDYQSLGTADFTTQPPSATGLTIDRFEGRSDYNRLDLDSGNVVEVTFNSPMPMLTMFEFDALVARAAGRDGYAPITVTVNGTSIINDYTIAGDGWNYTESCFMLPPALVRTGANQISIQVSQHSRTLLWLRAMRVRALLNGPAVRRELATSVPCYRAHGQISSVPLMLLICRPSSALGIVSSINEFAGNATITEAIGILDSAADDMIWMQSAITAALAGTNAVDVANRRVAD